MRPRFGCSISSPRTLASTVFCCSAPTGRTRCRASTGGPQTYTGKDVLSAHKHMNISELELVSAIDDAVNAMTKNGYDQTEINEVVAILFSLKNDMLHV